MKVTSNILGDVVSVEVDRELLTHNLRIGNDAAKAHHVLPGQKAFIVIIDRGTGVVCSADKGATVNAMLRSAGQRTESLRWTQPE